MSNTQTQAPDTGETMRLAKKLFEEVVPGIRRDRERWIPHEKAVRQFDLFKESLPIEASETIAFDDIVRLGIRELIRKRIIGLVPLPPDKTPIPPELISELASQVLKSRTECKVQVPLLGATEAIEQSQSRDLGLGLRLVVNPIGTGGISGDMDDVLCPALVEFVYPGYCFHGNLTVFRYAFDRIRSALALMLACHDITDVVLFGTDVVDSWKSNVKFSRGGNSLSKSQTEIPDEQLGRACCTSLVSMFAKSDGNYEFGETTAHLISAVYDSMERADRTRIERSLHFFIESSAEQDLTYSSLNLCIAFECLLGWGELSQAVRNGNLWEEKSGDLNLGKKEKICDRLSILIGGKFQERAENAKVISELYRIRSLVAHGERIRISGHAPAETTRRARHLFRRALVKSIICFSSSPSSSHWKGLARLGS